MGTSRKDFLKNITMGAAGLGTSQILSGPTSENKSPEPPGSRGSRKSNDYYVSNRRPLAATPYTELPIGNIKPKGWLLEQLHRQRNGLTGNLDEVYPRVVGPSNGWLGGDGDGWERGPYWLDGLVPLAYILDDPQLQEKAQQWIDWSLENQPPSGYFGPIPFKSEPEPIRGVQRTPRRDWWPKMVMLKVLKQYYMATQDERVLELMTNYFRYQLETLPNKELGHWSFWANRRGGDNLQVVYWLYNHTGDSFLLELGQLLHAQTFDWTSVMGEGKMGKTTPLPHLHCVNVAQGLKEPIIFYQQEPSEKYLAAVNQGLDDLKEVHGFVNGMYGGDERLHGNDPTQGSELCSAVELMYSLESLIPITGDVRFADHLERVAFNTLPTQINDTFTAKQYFQQANQIKLTNVIRNFFNDGNAQLCYGILTGYPCCVSNMHQGWPKFVQNLWYATADNGLAALVYGSSEVTARVGASGTEVTITEETDYPFDGFIHFDVSAPIAVDFPLDLRIPDWSDGATIRINGRIWKQVEEGNEIVSVKRSWQDGDRLTLELPMEVSISRWAEASAGVERGPLAFALKIEEEWKEVPPDPDNWTIRNPYYEVFPQTPWNYGLTQQTVDELDFELVSKDNHSEYPWNLENTPVELKARGKRIEAWKEFNNSAGPLPVSGQHLYEREDPTEDVKAEEITLVPYGATTLRISQFPVVK